MTIISLCHRIITLAFAALFFLVPLLLTPINYELFEYNKMMAVYALTVIIVGTWTIKMIAQKEIRIARTPLDIPLALFVSSQLLSSLFSIDPHISWFGYYSRFNGGMLSLISYVLLYYAFVSNYNNYNDYKRYITLPLVSATLVALYGLLEHFGIDKHLWVQDVQNRVFSTLGQPNWLAAYLVALAPLAWCFTLQAQNSKLKTQNFLWMGISALFFLVLLFTRSRSGLLGFAIADAIFWIFVFAKNIKKSFLPFFVLHSAFFLVIFLNGTHIESIDRWLTLDSWKHRFQKPTTYNLQPTTSPAIGGTLLEYGGTESGKIRKYVWQAAINAWKSSPKATLIGTGTETFAFAFFRYKPVGHNLTSEWDFLYNKAHNEYLNYLATTGLLGLGSYLLLIGIFIVWFLKFSIFNFQFSMKISNFKFQIEDNTHQNFHDWILGIALFSGWTSILVTNFFGFSVVITNLFFFLFPAMIIASSRHVISFIVIPAFTLEGQAGIQSFAQSGSRLPASECGASSGRDDKIAQPKHFFIFLVLLVLLVLLLLLAKFWYADTLFAGGYRYSRAAQFPVAYPLLSRAIHFNGNEPLYHDEYAAILAGLSAEAFENKQASTGAELVKLSLSESDKALSTSPQNVNFWKTRTKIFYAFANLDPQWNKAAIESLTKAAELAPTDPKIFYNLAILYGRQSDNKKAIELLQKTINLKSNYRDAVYALWVFYTETKQTALAKKILQTYLEEIDPNDKDFLSRL